MFPPDTLVCGPSAGCVEVSQMLSFRGLLPSYWAIQRDIQSTLVISTSVISNNRLSRRENLIPVLT